MKAERSRVAVAGVGYWGINLVRTFAQEPRAELTWLCDPRPQALAGASRLAPHARTSDAFQTVLDAEDVDAVVIAAPAVMHADMARRALCAGKHVFVEKPLALSARDAEQVAEAAAAATRILMVGHLMVYHPAIEYLRALIAGGDLGELLYLYSTRVNLGRARQDENALWSFAPHDISMIDYLLDGAEPVSVTATGESYLHPGIEDVVFLTLKLASRQMAHVHLSWLDPRKERRLTVVGSKKMAVFDDVSAEKLRIYDKSYEKPPEFKDFGEYLTIRHGGVYIPHIKMIEPLAVECGHFLECIAGGAVPRTGVDSAMRVVRILAAAQESLDQGGGVISLG